MRPSVMNHPCLPAVLLSMMLAACAAPSHVLVGTARAPIPVEQVVIYPQPPANSQDIAILNASSHSVFSPGGQRVTDAVIQRLKLQAAQLGANGLVLQDFSDKVTGSLAPEWDRNPIRAAPRSAWEPESRWASTRKPDRRSRYSCHRRSSRDQPVPGDGDYPRLAAGISWIIVKHSRVR